MIEIEIFKNTSPRKIDDLYKNYIDNDKVDDVTLIIPGKFEKYKFGLIADLFRFIITLNIKSQIKILKIDVSVDSIDSIYNQEYIYPIISLLWNTSKFVDNNNKDIKEVLREQQNKFFSKMNSLEKFKGHKYILSHTDHLSRNNGLIKLFENINGFIDDEVYITKLVKRILNENVLTFNNNNQDELKSIIEDVGAIIYELSKNTFEWGKTDFNMKPVTSSIRGTYFRFHKTGYNNLIEEFQGTPLKKFFQHNYIRENCIQKYSYKKDKENIEVENVYYLEILVYDSGVGFIEKFNDTSGLSDIAVIKKCLIKNQTASISNLKSKKGIGLDRILNTIDKKGFLRIMTDKYCVYRDLIQDNYSALKVNELNDLKLDDWNENNFKPKGSNRCQGSYINILYPFKNLEL